MRISPVVAGMSIDRACQVAVITDHKPTRTALIKALSVALVRLKHDRKILGQAKGDPAKPATWPKGAARAKIFHAAATCADMIKKVEGAIRGLHGIVGDAVMWDAELEARLALAEAQDRKTVDLSFGKGSVH